MHHSDVTTQSAFLSLKGLNMPSTYHDALAAESEEYQRLDAVLSLLFPPTVRVQQSQNILGHMHCLRRLTLSNRVRLLLKSSPLPRTPLLRHERLYLETEARVLALLGHNANPCIPRLYHYDPRGAHLGSAFLVRQYVKGSRLSDMQGRLTARQCNDIDRHLGFLAATIGQNVAPGFGTLQQVAIGAGKRSWREAFCALFESVLRDAEDMFIHLPYAEIRHELVRLAAALEEVTLPRLTVVGFGRPTHVFLDEESKQLSGVVDFSSAFWGDLLMAEIFEDPSPAVLEGAALPLFRTKKANIRVLMYSCYRLVCQITIQYYRSRDEPKEFYARRRLTAAIAKLMVIESA
ncbi:Aminoglycoside phosphotransferase [Penicillium canariense]|uniref:Aminoglycoside phosphotransferase n=1 Tax=Penicillium canariense TaxID=189055 RepID=A0A9W9LSJ0_9EURO|nr:Aminoglycoside phosphotransferase [Penicillium canariense]KAJ5174425.1 Aminoglycoside phosphotransferase [Penicillium canariense]